MAVDPFADIRCDDCGWVHFRELPCPKPTTAWLYRRLLEALNALGHEVLKAFE